MMTDGDLMPRALAGVSEKIFRRHRERLAMVYIRQSTVQQVERHQESTRLQYALVDRAIAFGWARETVVCIDGEPAPKEPAPAIPPRQPLLPDPLDLIGVPAYSSKVASYAVVGIVAPHHRSQMGALVRDRLMPVDPTPSRNRRQRAGVTVLCRYLPPHILACPRLAPDVGEAEEG